jgi:superfamily II DNA or RNA helicase/HKD family nuclease
MTLSQGLYDLIVSSRIAERMAALPTGAVHELRLSPEESAERLLDFLRDQLGRVLAEIGDRTDAPAQSAAQLALINALTAEVRAQLAPETAALVEDVQPPPRALRAITSGIGDPPSLPETGLLTPWLFTAGRGSPSLLDELRRELAASDQVDVLVSFITVSGVRKLYDLLQQVTAADAQGEGRTRIRVLTTTYIGATEQAALDKLAQLNGCEVRVSLDGRRTRLHAKAWIFRRRTGFGSAYVGSANLSGAALVGGLEWTVKVTERGQEALYSRACAHFDTLWEDGEFSRYDPRNDESRQALAAALQRESGPTQAAPDYFFDIHPRHFQREMLDQLERERAAGRTRNLVVAATGTGKTVVAALDYRRTCERLGHRPRLLFVAHRAQILRQALRTYREVLRDHQFGEFLTGGDRPIQYDHLFATINSISSRQLVENLGTDYWHTVVIDECHRLPASRLSTFATAIRPQQLLGLTATPERTDGQPLAPFFTPRPDGAPAVELRLWDALDMQLLAPFEYYACDDPTDFTGVNWDHPEEREQLERLLAGNDARARMVVNEWRRLAADPSKSRAIVFCVSVAHARFMTEWLCKSGLPSLCVTGETPRAEQIRAPRRLSSGEVCALVTVDLYNEGVDLPDADTLLLLRPTQSALLFQQQLGRGLRLSPGKDSCLVLDFVGQHRADFRFDRLFGPITGLTRRQLVHAVEHGFSGLPPGCHIQLSPQTRAQVLNNLRRQLHQGWQKLTMELRAFSALRGTPAVGLRDFTHEQHVPLEEIYRDSKVSGWTTLRRAAGLLDGPPTPNEAYLSRRFRDLLHQDDPDVLRVTRRVAETRAAFVAESDADAVRAQMLTYQVDSRRAAMPYQDFIADLDENPACADELAQLADILVARSRLAPTAIPGVPDVPLSLHGAYRIREILTAFGWLTPTRRTPFQAGVLPLGDQQLELLFVTLDKSAGYHDRIAYHDYAISPTRFHWQTQNAAGPDTPAGRRYLESHANGWRFQLFVRTTPDAPYRACGPVSITDPSTDVSGDRPMSIIWTLEVPLPGRLFSEFSVLRQA